MARLVGGSLGPREEFAPTGWYVAMAARALTGLGLLLYVLGTLGSSGRQ
jgi:hypothetical protein